MSLYILNLLLLGKQWHKGHEDHQSRDHLLQCQEVEMYSFGRGVKTTCDQHRNCYPLPKQALHRRGIPCIKRAWTGGQAAIYVHLEYPDPVPDVPMLCLASTLASTYVYINNKTIVELEISMELCLKKASCEWHIYLLLTNTTLFHTHVHV